MNLIDQLVEFYLEKETTHEKKLSAMESYKYFDKLLNQGSIITVSDGDLLLGYVETWRLSFEQFGRIICGESFSAFHEDILTGQIAYVGDVYIRPEYRNSRVTKMMRNRFFEFNKNCTHFVGEAKRKKSCPVKVFKVKDIHINKEEKEMAYVG
jgi:hypothetical protein